MKDNFKRIKPIYKTITTEEESKLLKSLGLDCNTASFSWVKECGDDGYDDLSLLPYREYTKTCTFSEDIYLPCWTIEDFFNILSSNSLILKIEKRSDTTIGGMITYHDTVKTKDSIYSIGTSLFNLLYKLISAALGRDIIKN